MADLPAGNIPLTLLGACYEALSRLRLRRPYDDAEVAYMAGALRIAFARLDL